MAAPTWDDSGSYVMASPSPVGDTEGSAGILEHTPTGSAGGSLQNDSGSVLLGADAATETLEEFGFHRSEMYSSPLVGTVQFYARHLFLCYKNPESWPPQVEAAEFDRLPRLLAAALKQRKNEIPRKTRLTICEGRDGTETSNGDVLIFPDMIRYKGLTHFDVDSFVEEVLVKNTEWPSGNPGPLTGWYVFVCSHASRDRRCGFCGPALIKIFREELENRGLKGNISVSPCSHVGGHKYAGNVIIYGPNADGEIAGHWYGYVTPDDVPILIEQHIGKGEVVDRLWRGQMGLAEEEQQQAQQERMKLNEVILEKIDNETDLNDVKNLDSENELKNEKDNLDSFQNGESCCQNSSSTKCYQKNVTYDYGPGTPLEIPSLNPDGNTKEVSSQHYSSNVASWFETWEREDTLATLAVIGAVASIAIAYGLYRKSS